MRETNISKYFQVKHESTKICLFYCTLIKSMSTTFNNITITHTGDEITKSCPTTMQVTGQIVKVTIMVLAQPVSI